MGILWYSIGTLALSLAVGLTLCTLGYRWARHDGYDAGYNEGRADRAQEELAERHTARHARTTPRQATSGPGGPVKAPAGSRRRNGQQSARDTTPTIRQGSVEGPAGPGQDEQPPWNAQRWYSEIPGPDRPQPGRDSGAGTLTMARIELPATTGEMAAITDEYIERMQLEEAEHRRTLTA